MTVAYQIGDTLKCPRVTRKFEGFRERLLLRGGTCLRKRVSSRNVRYELKSHRHTKDNKVTIVTVNTGPIGIATVTPILWQENMAQVPLISAEERMAEADPLNMVMLEVGLPGDTWRYCVERERLAARSEWFRAMLLGRLAPPPSNPPPLIKLQHVEKRAFDHLLRYLHDEPVNFNSVSTARATLDAAHQYLCLELARLAVEFLEKNLNTSTILEVYQGLDLFASDSTSAAAISRTTDTTSPSAPPEPGDDVAEIEDACNKLLSSCLCYIDSEATAILSQERFEELTAEELATIVSRDSLKLPKEGVLFKALERWAAAECRRQGVEPTPCNKRRALSDDIWYSVRYLLMTDREFIAGPMASGVLSSEESAFIVAKILGHDKERTRISQLNGPLSRLSSVPRFTGRISKDSAGDRNANISKPGKKEREDNKRNRRKECASQGQRACARIGDCLVRVLACVFD